MEASKIGLAEKEEEEVLVTNRACRYRYQFSLYWTKAPSPDFLHLAQGKGTLGFTADFDSSTTDLGSTLPGQLTAEKSVAADLLLERHNRLCGL